ncbi:hypothetical protein IHE55_17650 [Streptomyces pactum]|uniref:Uncharacterized protein n=1 Tax=Streptomyces pactum TaxID=68249 RepID=A0ABS0NN59_9ACTN|nr:hypothetical protein [Streptomyces pactum]
MTVRPQRHRGCVRFRAAVDDVIDPVGHPATAEPAGPVEREPPAAVLRS